MKHRGLILGLMALSSVFRFSAAYAGRCGPFDMFEGSDYCVSCQTGTSKVYSCPGGDVGMVAVGVANPGCTVSYYSSSCQTNMSPLSAAAKAKQDKEFNSAKPGHPALSKKGDEVIIRMKQADFDRFMQSK